MVFEFNLDALMNMNFSALFQLIGSLNSVIDEHEKLFNIARETSNIELRDYCLEVLDRCDANLVLVKLAISHLEDEVIIDTQLATFSLN